MTTPPPAYVHTDDLPKAALQDDTPINPDERNAMRAFLQRTEVRLSTLHRIAVAFISGAGLLILFPTFFKEEILALIRIFLAHTEDAFPALGGDQLVIRLILYGLLAYPFVLSLVTPIYSMVILIKDVVHFYFTIYMPGYPTELNTPSFALSGVAFSPDESDKLKKQVLAAQYRSSAINFAIPFSEQKREAYFDDMIRATDGDILPRTRQYDQLKALGVLADNVDRTTVDRLNAAFGLARTLDRQLVEEVAMTELSLVRHILYLRRLVLRYIRTLLMFIWTAIVTFIMLPFLEDARLPTFLVMAIGYSVWSVWVVPIMHLPLNWIYRHKHGSIEKLHLDRQLTNWEVSMRPFCIAAAVTSLAAVVLCTLLYFGA